jgi:hypothetical protein
MAMPASWSLLAASRPSQRLGRLDQGHAATGDDALLDGGAGRGDGVLDAVLALLQLHLGVPRRP